mmetsp:Transcript_17385/g.44167  ORF Transcript_17385/g.44167 Transcript_17385/m.44167 type:complete len:326 (+) Transcript_17385:116-1093(+)
MLRVSLCQLARPTSRTAASALRDRLPLLAAASASVARCAGRWRAQPGPPGLEPVTAALAPRAFASDASDPSTVLTSVTDGVGVITINRRKALNALNREVMEGVVAAAQAFDASPEVRALVLTGAGEKAFACGADIKEMSTKSHSQVYAGRMFDRWDELRRIRKPLVGAINGYALGGGCELAMMCDIIIASETASFGQPELTLGVIPGMGGTQRLTRLVGRAKAMDLILTCRRIDATEAERIGLVSRVVPAEKLMEEALAVASGIARLSAPAVAKAKECVHMTDEAHLGTGLQYERREFGSLFAYEDQKEGMGAFLDKRDAQWTDN